MTQEGVTMPGVGLILAVDAKEPYPCEIGELIEQMKKGDPNQTDEESARNLKAILDAQKQTQEAGLEMSVVLSLALIPVRPEAVCKIVDGFPADLASRVRWCAICPTDRRLTAAFKELCDAGLKKAKLGLAQRAAIAAMRPMAERKGVEMMKKGRQLGFYSLLVGAAKDLSPELKRQRIASYQEKLGLSKQPDSNDGAGTPTDPNAGQKDPNTRSVSSGTQRRDRSAA